MTKKLKKLTSIKITSIKFRAYEDFPSKRKISVSAACSSKAFAALPVDEEIEKMIDIMPEVCYNDHTNWYNL